MTIAMVARTIQLIIAPVVMISASSLIINGLINRYTSIGNRLRQMSKERLEIVWGSNTPLQQERAIELDFQMPHLLFRHRLLHRSVLGLYYAILMFVIDMLVIAAAVMFDNSYVATGAIGLFIIGMFTLAAGVVIAVSEVYTSHDALRYEIQRVMEVVKENPSPPQ